MIDVHAHFALEGYDFPAEWKKIEEAGVRTVILASDTLPHSKWHGAFCKRYAGAYFCAGIHPSETANFFEERAGIAALLSEEKCVAVGEIGLDYHYPDCDKERQREAFVSQILLAEEFGLPIQIHSRDALRDTLAILEEMKEHIAHGYLLHCYSYGREEMDKFLCGGAYFSFGGVTCFKNARRVLESAAYCPSERILSETDSPYLSPFRGEKNSPANIPVIVKKLAEIRGTETEELTCAIRENALRLFPKLR